MSNTTPACMRRLRSLSAVVETQGAAAEAALLGEGLALQWLAPVFPSCGGLHGMHRYPAPMQRAACEHWTSCALLPPGTFLDPFCGAGATLDAASFAQHSRFTRVVGCDLSPLAVSIARGHLAAFFRASDGTQEDQRAAAAAALGDIGARMPTVARVVSDRMARCAGRGGAWTALREELEEEVGRGGGPVDDALWFVFSALRHRYGERNERRRTRRRGKGVSQAFTVAQRFTAAAASYASVAAQLDAERVARVRLHCVDVRQLTSVLAPASIDAVLTSPPYPGVYDYLAVAREAEGGFKVGALPPGADGEEIAPFSELKRTIRHAIRSGEGNKDIQGTKRLVAGLRGASERAEATKKRAEEGLRAFIAGWQADTEAWVQELGRALREGGRAVIIVGDGAGVNTLDTFERAAASCDGLVLVSSASISSTQDSPSLRDTGARRAEHAILLERVSDHI